jgi:carbonic anhydrase
MVDEGTREEKLSRTEQRSVAVQMERLISYPMVREALAAGELSIHGWYYVIEKGRMLALDVDSGAFVPLS